MLRLHRSRATLLAVAAVTASAALIGCGAPAETGHEGGHVASVSSPAEGPYAGREISEPRPRPDFVLTDQDGTSFDFSARTAGEPTLLFFGYANCPDVCPTTMADVALALRSVPEDLATHTQVVFVTTDPARDTPEFLGEYLARFDQDLPTRFVGLTGTQAEIEDAQLRAGVALAEANGEMHATSLLLYGSDDLARVMFTAGDTADEIARDLETLAAG